MNTISASAPPARIRPLRIAAKMARKLANFIAPRDHAGKGNWKGHRYPLAGMAPARTSLGRRARTVCIPCAGMMTMAACPSYGRSLMRAARSGCGQWAEMTKST